MIPASDWLGRRAAETPDAVGLIDGARVTYREWNARVARTAALLLDAGLAKGDRLAVLATNRAEWVDLLFACQKTGIVLQALNWRLSEDELRAIVAKAPPKALAFSRDVVKDLGIALRFDLDALPLPRSGVDAAPMRATDPWVLCYTGGTTGIPKAAILTHGSMLANAAGTSAGWKLRSDDIALVSAPLFHAGGMGVFLTSMAWLGATTLLARKFDAGETLDAIERHRVTLFFGVPTMWRMLADHPRFASADLSSLRFAISGGAPIDDALCARLHARGIPFTCGYGLTEAGPNNFQLDPSDARKKPGAVGVPLPHVEMKLVDGEVRLRGPHLFAGYLGETDSPLDEDGFLRTGDIAVRDEQGCVRIVGRTKEMFISGGENVFPAEVECALTAHPAVSEAAVIAMRDETWGEVGWAAVVLRAPIESDELRAFVRNRLAGYKVPRRVVPLTAIPKTTAGKIDRAAVRRALALDRADTAVPVM